MEIEKIFLSLDEGHRKAAIALTLCTLIIYSVLFISVDVFSELEWYTQLLLSLGLSVVYLTCFFAVFILLIMNSYIFYFALLCLSLAYPFWLIPSVLNSDFEITVFLKTFGLCIGVSSFSFHTYISILFFFLRFIKLVSQIRHCQERSIPKSCNSYL